LSNSLTLKDLRRTYRLLSNLKKSSFKPFSNALIYTNTVSYISKVLQLSSLNRPNHILLSKRNNHPKTGFSELSKRFFLKMRTIRRLKLRANAQRLGLFPRRERNLFKGKFRLNRKDKGANFHSLKNIAPASSVFSKSNYKYMQLLVDFSSERFRFTRIKSLYLVLRKKRLAVF